MVKLAFEPYNANRIDCYWNNVVAILMTRHEEFEALVPLVASQYVIPVPKREIISAAEFTDRQQNGLLLPYLTRELPDELCDRYIERTELSLGRDTDIVELVRQYVRGGYYCVVRLDRYHFPFCPESLQRSLVHPVLVFGYDDERQVVYAVEDCIPPGKMNVYELSYESLQGSYNSVAETELFGLSLRVLQERMDKDAPYGVIRNNIHRQLYGEPVETEQQILLHGLAAVEYYREHFAEAALAMSGQDVHANLRLSYPLFYQQRNLMLVGYLGGKGILSNREQEELHRGFQELCNAWGLIRTKLIQYYIKPERPSVQDYAAEMEPYLEGCLKERELLLQLLAALERAGVEAS